MNRNRWEAVVHQEKSVRLLAEGAVQPDLQRCQSFTVRGDHGTYCVIVGATIALCTCPAIGRCSHINAAVAWVRASVGERALMLQALNERKARDAAAANALLDILAA